MYIDCEVGDCIVYVEIVSGVVSVLYFGMLMMLNKCLRLYLYNYSGLMFRVLKVFFVVSVVILFVFIMMVLMSGKIEEFRASFAVGFFEDEGGDKVIMDGSVLRRDCGLM